MADNSKQVKFYSVTTYPPSNTADANGIYFKNGGQLYKGATRFGTPNLFTDETTASET